MTSERLQRRIDRLLDQAEEAADERDWSTVAESARMVLRLDAENRDAVGLLAMVEEAGGAAAADSSQPAAAELAEERTQLRELPASFVDGRYQVTDFLGKGGRKQVYLAHDTRLDRDVAFALIKTEGLDANGRQRIQREAQAMGRLSGHPHIVTIHDVGEEDGQPYIVSEYMAGGDVEALIVAADDHQLDLERAVSIATQVSRALEHAHADGVVHRDIKPGNIWLAEDGTAKLGDFGLAFAASETRMTTEGTMLGTVAYMPPEQALGGAATPQSDLYSLGCALYEIVTGRPPFLGDDAVAVISQHLNAAPVAPSWSRRDCPSALEALIETLLAKQPADRPASAAAVRAELASIDLTVPAGGMEHQNPLDRLAHGVFVGREEEMQRLRRAFDSSLGGHGELVMLVGQPGIGKTRTTYELETYAKMRGAQVLWGRIHEASGAPSYWPWIQIGRAWDATNDRESLRLSGETSGELSRLFPEMLGPGGAAPTPVQDAEAAQFRLFDAFATFVRQAAAQSPLMIVVDDLHWADKPSLLLLQYLARELAGMRVLVVGTFRDTDLVRTHPLSETLASLNRESGFERLTLRGLTADECATYIRDAANVEPSAPVLAKIVEETEGNPFFLSEVVSLMAQEGTLDKTSLSDITIPDGVREALGRRLDRISEEANSLLRWVAVVGREFDYGTLELVHESETVTLLEILEEAIEARVIEELGAPGRYRFTHHLMQETLLAELSITRRVRMHGQIGDALETRFGDQAPARAPVLAPHFVDAATLSTAHAAKAVQYSKIAAERAESEAAFDEAVRHYQACADLMRESGSDFGEDEAALLSGLAASGQSAARLEVVPAAFSRALDLYRERRDWPGFGQALRRALERGGVGAFYGATRTSIPGTLQLIDEAVSGLGEADRILSIRLLLGPGWFGRSLTPEQAAEAESLTKEFDLPDVEASLHSLAGSRAYEEMRLDDAAGEFQAAYDAFDRAGDFGQAVTHLRYVGITYLNRGMIDEAVAATEIALSYSQQSGHRLAEGACHDTLRMLRRLHGDRERVEIRPLAHPISQAQFIAEYEWRGDAGDAVDVAHNLDVEVSPRFVHAVRARTFLLGGERELAERAFSAWSDDYEPGLVLVDEITLSELDDALPELGDEQQVRVVYDHLRRWTEMRTGRPNGRGFDHMRGALALRLDLVDEAHDWYRAGLDWAAAARVPLEIGRNHQGLAEVALRHDDRSAARDHLQSARDVFQQYGIRLYLSQVLAKLLELQGIDDLRAVTSIDAVAASIDTERPDLTPRAAPDGTVTLLFSDIENSTARTAELGDARWMELLREHNTIVRAQLAAHSGYEVKSMGDGFMLAFRSAVDGLRCAIGMQQGFAERNTLSDEPIRVRIGLHTGEAIKEADDFFGSHVNLAARVAGAATGEEILVSGLLKALTESAGEFSFDAGREVDLKGISGPQRVHAVEWR